MKIFKRLLTVAGSLITLFLLPSTTFALIIVSGSDSNVTLNNGAYADGTDATVPSAYRNPELIKNVRAGPETSALTPLYQVPYDSGFFVFIYDQQETKANGGANMTIQITGISIDIGSTNIWTLADTIELDGTTNSPLSNAGDMALHVPISLFAGFTASDEFTFSTTQADYDNGGDEWIVRNVGSFFEPGDCISGTCESQPPTAAVPEPSILALMSIGLAGMGIARKRVKT